ncbi:MAG: hypothetical protein CEN92_222 [Candidatus Berkelbacteria bacterium Licking1014_96]|uniref:Uncharacterized protein n=1 Tax=Candidatus Berkelbacteria bacterium Licking1014_96 TaxID=2017149 RepID=A0A554LFJ9_9BACT|nr:MAG: hypothetical protein CEN92_222 [Candidatus Berkelbacteria bacterium Licking1014_96]
MAPKPIFAQPIGPSETPSTVGQGHWNNMCSGFCGDGPEDWDVCGLCGTKHMAPRDGDSLLRMRLLGIEGFEECCGKALDVVFRESGEEFTIVFLKQFAQNPTDSRFWILRHVLGEILTEAAQRVAEVSADIAQAQTNLTNVCDKVEGEPR